MNSFLAIQNKKVNFYFGLNGVWGDALPHETLFEAVGKKSVLVCYKTIKKEENLQNARKCSITNIMAIAMLKPL